MNKKFGMMKKIYESILIMGIMALLNSCSPGKKITAEQIDSNYPIILVKAKNVENKISTVRIPLVFEISKHTLKEIKLLIPTGYLYKNQYYQRSNWTSTGRSYHVEKGILKENLPTPPEIKLQKKEFVFYTSHRPHYTKGDELYTFFQPYLNRMEKERKDTLQISTINELKNGHRDIIENFLEGDTILIKIFQNRDIDAYTYPVEVK